MEYKLHGWKSTGSYRILLYKPDWRGSLRLLWCRNGSVGGRRWYLEGTSALDSILRVR